MRDLYRDSSEESQDTNRAFSALHIFDMMGMKKWFESYISFDIYTNKTYRATKQVFHLTAKRAAATTYH